MKINNLQGLRFLAFLLVFLNHTYGIIGIEKIFDFGARGVEIFFILSGYLTAYNYHGKIMDASIRGSILYASKKLKKFYLLHFVTFLAFLFLAVIKFYRTGMLSESIEKFLLNIFLNITLLKSWYYASAFSFNGVTWFLSSILFSYLFAPKVVNIFFNKKCSTVFFYFVFLFVIKLICDTIGYKILSYSCMGFVLYVNPFYRFIEFLLGYMSFLLFKSIELKEINISALQLIFLAFYFCSCVYFDNIWVPSLFVLCEIMLIFLSTLQRGVLDSILGNSFFVYLGNISFELYIFHCVVIEYILKLKNFFQLNYLNGYMILLLIFGITVYLSTVFRKVERKKCIEV